MHKMHKRVVKQTMELFKLLEKNGKIQISIIHYLLDENLTAAIPKLLTDLEITSFLFNNNIEELAVILNSLELDLSLEVNHEQNQITLKKNNQTNLDRLYYHYLQESTKYQILRHLYHRSTYSIYELAQKFLISEAAVYRHITGLNQLLDEFNIKIRRGKITGDELQICYFFFQLFWNSVPLEAIQGKENDQNSLLFISFLEKKLNQQFGSTTQLKLYLWIRILKKRTKKIIAPPSIESMAMLNENYLEDPVYQLVRESYFLSVSPSAEFQFEYKATYLYLFISSLFVIERSKRSLLQADDWPTFNTKVIELNKMVVQQVRTAYRIDSVEIDPRFIQEWKYFLTQLHSTIVYFKGNITFFEEQMLFDRLVNQSIFTPNFELVQQIIQKTERILGFSLLDTTKQLVNRIHLYFINQMRRFSQLTIQIGIFCSRDNLQTNIMMESIKNEFDAKFYIHCEEAELDKNYDLLISDSAFGIQQFSFKDLYIINDFKTQADIQALTCLLKDYSKKEGI